MTARPSQALGARIAAWLARELRESDVAEGVAQVIVRTPADAGDKLPLAAVEVPRDEAPEATGARLAEVLVTLAAGDPTATSTAFRLYLSTKAGHPLRTGWQVRVTRDDVERAVALAELADNDDDRARARRVDAATAHLLVRQAQHAEHLQAAVVAANADVRRQSEVTINGMSALAGALNVNARMAEAAITAADARARAADEARARAESRVRELETENGKLLAKAQELLALVQEAQDDADTKRKVLEMLRPLAARAAAYAMNGAGLQ